MAAYEDGPCLSVSQEHFRITHGPRQGFLPLRIGDVVPVAAGPDGDVAAYRVMRTLHEVSRFQHRLSLLPYLFQQPLTVFQAAIHGTGDDGVGLSDACLCQGLQGGEQRALHEFPHTASIQRPDVSADTGQLILRGDFNARQDLDFLLCIPPRLRNSGSCRMGGKQQSGIIAAKTEGVAKHVFQRDVRNTR